MFKINNTVLMSYEENIQDGVVFLFNASDESSWTGNYNSYEIIRLLNGTNNLEFIINRISSTYPDIPKGDIMDSTLEIIEELKNKNFLSEV